MAEGIGGVGRRGWQYWLEQDGVSGLQMPPDVIPREGSPT